MRQYDKELYDYLVDLEDDAPRHATLDPNLRLRSLGAQSPPLLVKKVAESLDERRLADCLTQLTDFERARVFMMTNHKEEAIQIFNEIVMTSDDDELKGKCLANMANLVRTEKQRLLLLNAANALGNLDAKVQLANEMIKNGLVEFGMKELKDALRAGSELALQMLHFALADSLGKQITTAQELQAQLEEINTIAIEAGIDPEEAMPTWSMKVQLPQLKDSNFVSTMHHMHKLHTLAAQGWARLRSKKEVPSLISRLRTLLSQQVRGL